jgi:Mg2+-importing ATPase
VVSLVMRDWIEAWIILGIVIGSCLLGFYQEYRASTAIAALRARMALKVRVRRDGASLVIDASAVVPGDIVELTAGNLVPVDGVVLQARDFLVSEASLTGESFPVEKQAGILTAATEIRERSNCVFLGTSVRSGTASVLAVHTGLNTAFGAVAASLLAREPETEFARGIRNFGYLLLRLMVVMVLFVLVVNQIEGRPVFESLLFAVALAVGLVATRLDGSPLRYNVPELLLPDLVVCHPDRADEVRALLDAAGFGPDGASGAGATGASAAESAG